MSNTKLQRKLREIEVSGSPYEMGFQYGSACPEIRKMLDLAYKEFGLERNASIALAEKYIPRYLPFTEAYAPDIVNEMKGIAEGAKVDFREVFLLNNFPEILVPRYVNCTSFAASGQATSHGEIIIGQNLDFPPAWEEMLVLLKMTPTEGPSILAVALAGTLARFGVNSAGITLNGNLVVHQDLRRLPVAFL